VGCKKIQDVIIAIPERKKIRNFKVQNQITEIFFNVGSVLLKDLTTSLVRRYFICSEANLWTHSSCQFSLLDEHNDYPVSLHDLMVNRRPLFVYEPLYNYVTAFVVK
jgi:hypothetical protein